MTQGNIAPIQEASNPIDPGMRIGHVHLRTADIDRVRGFYVDVLGFDVVAEARDVPGWGTTGDILFVSAGGYPATSASTPGSRPAATRSPTESPACTTSRSTTPPVRAWPTRSGGCSAPACRFASFRTTARTRPSISPIPTATISSWPGTGRSISGRGPRAAVSRRRLTTSISTISCQSPSSTSPETEASQSTTEAPDTGRSTRLTLPQGRSENLDVVDDGPDPLLSIGEFARRTRLTTKARCGSTIASACFARRASTKPTGTGAMPPPSEPASSSLCYAEPR